MQIRTDLALEAAEKAPEMPQLTAEDVEKTQLTEGEATVTRHPYPQPAGQRGFGTGTRPLHHGGGAAPVG